MDEIINGVRTAHDYGIEEAKQIAREVIREAWPTVVEIAEPTDGMYEFDAICIDDEECPVSAIAIMHGADAETFSLVEELRPATTRARSESDNPKSLPAWPIDWDRLKQDREIAFLRGDLATSSPESYTLDEMREISEAMDSSTAEVEEALRADFNAMSPRAQCEMLDMICKADPANAQWWKDLLIGDMPNSTEEL